MNERFVIQPLNIEEAGKISIRIKQKLIEQGYPKAFVRRVAIATYEAEINTVIHSHGGECAVVNVGENLVIEFKDIGPGIDDITLALQEGFSTASKLAIENGFGAGMGFANIQKACDDFHITSSPKGTYLTLMFKM